MLESCELITELNQIEFERQNNGAKTNYIKFGKRHIQIINIFLLIFVAYYTRNCLSVGVIAMTDSNSTNSNVQTFNWTNKNIILSSFFIGYVPSQMAISWVIPRTNIKILAVSSMIICSILGLFTPTIATALGDTGVSVTRMLQGVSQGFVFPLIQHMLAFWVPPNERSVLGGVVYAGRPLATVLAMLIPGFIATSFLGWPWIFYSSNVVSLIWCLSFAYFSYENPEEHPTISIKEQKFIEESIGESNLQDKSTPFKEILSSVPFWAITFAAFGTVWGFWTLQTQIPMYLKYVLKFDVESSGLISALPYLMQFLASCTFGFISDYLLQKQFWSIGTARKTMTSIGCFIPASSLILLHIYGSDNSTKAICLLTISVAAHGACFCGYGINHIDLSPNHSSVLVGISNGIAQSCGFLAPLFVQAVVKREDDAYEWRWVFYTSAGFYIAAGLIFAIFGSGQVQYWDNLKKQSKKSDNYLDEETSSIDYKSYSI